MEKQAQGGSVINMSYILGVVGGEKSQVYSAAKARVSGYTKSQTITYARKVSDLTLFRQAISTHHY